MAEINKITVLKVLTSGHTSGLKPDFPATVGQAPEEECGAGQAVQRSTPCRVGGENPESNNEEWVEVSHKKSQAAKSASLEKPLRNSDKAKAPVVKVPTPLIKGVSKMSSSKGKAPVVSEESSKSRPARPVFSSMRTKTWYDPDDLDVERGSREERTVKVVLPPGTKGLTRADFVDRVNGVVGLHRLEACGPASAPHIWLLTFTTKEAMDAFSEAGNFLMPDGLPAQVHSKSRAHKFWIKIHWVPYEVPMVNALRELEAVEGIKIIAASYDKVTGSEDLSHVRSLLRSVLIETELRERVPYTLRWSHGSASGVALVTVKGRQPMCLRCRNVGHVRKDCDVQAGSEVRKGYAAVVAMPTVDEEAGLVEEDDEPVLRTAAEWKAIRTAKKTGEVEVDSAGNTRDTNALPTGTGDESLFNLVTEIEPVSEPIISSETVIEGCSVDDTLFDLAITKGLSWADRAPDDKTDEVHHLSDELDTNQSGTGDELDSSVSYSSPASSGSSGRSKEKFKEGVRKRSNKRERERDRLSSTQSASPRAKK
jgi:hypothetical protein